jgi:hypothetical protein
MSFGDAANSAPPRCRNTCLAVDQAGTTAQKSAFARHNNKGGSRIIITPRRPKLADIPLAAIFPSPCVLAIGFELSTQEPKLFHEYYTDFKHARQDCKSQPKFGKIYILGILMRSLKLKITRLRDAKSHLRWVWGGAQRAPRLSK